MKISTLRMYKFFQKDNPFDDLDHDPVVAIKWAGVALAILFLGGLVVAVVGTILWALYTQTWVWVRFVVTPLLFVPLAVLWLAWPTKKREAAMFLEGKK